MLVEIVLIAQYLIFKPETIKNMVRDKKTILGQNRRHEKPPRIIWGLRCGASSNIQNLPTLHLKKIIHSLPHALSHFQP